MECKLFYYYYLTIFKIEIVPKAENVKIATLINAFSVLKNNKHILRDRIILALDLNPYNDNEIITKETF